MLGVLLSLGGCAFGEDRVGTFGTFRLSYFTLGPGAIPA